ncbi:NEL-type E3 ubiquitin ligase domain-containing protein [Pseudomonas moorei]|uniref:NEL-type E3 ubiquitin ligase domain-containing protein n=1 Tax=Pseudomonas moorei TaxID=395599 RepID=UPI0036F21FED
MPGWGIDRANHWSELADEPQAQGFLKVLLETQLSKDFKAGGPAKDQLVQRVWRMLDAVYVDTSLREKLFSASDELLVWPVNTLRWRTRVPSGSVS